MTASRAATTLAGSTGGGLAIGMAVAPIMAEMHALVYVGPLAGLIMATGGRAVASASSR